VPLTTCLYLPITGFANLPTCYEIDCYDDGTDLTYRVVCFDKQAVSSLIDQTTKWLEDPLGYEQAVLPCYFTSGTARPHMPRIYADNCLACAE
jgi:hypothetical protein